jgi:hypothetical protein
MGKAEPVSGSGKHPVSEDETPAPDLARALSHPLRVKILVVLNEVVASPKELELLIPGGPKLPDLSYHCRQLLKYGCVEVVKHERVRGAVKTYYRAITRAFLDNDAWARMSDKAKTKFSVAAVKAVTDSAHDALIAQTFDKRPDRNAITLDFPADEQAWLEGTAIVLDAYEKLQGVEGRAANRDGEKIKMTISLLSYESPQSRP